MSNGDRLTVYPEQIIYSFDADAKRHLLDTEQGLRILAATSPELSAAWPPETTGVSPDVANKADLLRRDPAALALYLSDVLLQAYVEHAQRLGQELRSVSENEKFEPDTGLYKKAYWIAEVQRFVNHVSQHGGSGAILQFDIDNMKLANDHKKLGHATVDEVIARLLKRLSARARRNFKASRTGGDELSVLVSFLPEDNDNIASGDLLLDFGIHEERRGRRPLTDKQRAKALLNRMLAEFEEEIDRPMMIDGKMQSPRTFVKSFGVSGGFGIISPGVSGIDAIRAADRMAYSNKEEKRDQRFKALSPEAQAFIKGVLKGAERFRGEFEIDNRMFRF